MPVSISNGKQDFPHFSGSDYDTSSNSVPQRPDEMANDTLTEDELREDDDESTLDAYHISVRRQSNSHGRPYQFNPRLTSSWAVSRLQELPYELRHMVYQNLLLESQTFNINEGTLTGPLTTICNTHPEIELEISQKSLNANSRGEVYCLPWRNGHLFIPETTEFQFTTKAFDALKQSLQIDTNDLASWDAFIFDSPLTDIIRHINIEIQFPQLATNASIGETTLNDRISAAAGRLFDGLMLLPSIERFTLKISCPKLASFGDYDAQESFSFLIWDLFWSSVSMFNRHPGYVSSGGSRTPDLRLVIADGSDDNLVLDEILPGKFTLAQPASFPWYDTTNFGDFSIN